MKGKATCTAQGVAGTNDLLKRRVVETRGRWKDGDDGGEAIVTPPYRIGG